jgi:selenoprotein W-related protein
LKLFKNDIESLTIIPSDDGKFEVKLNDSLLFSKLEKDRFPEESEVEMMIRESLKAL